MTQKYYIIQGGASQGPYTVEELKQMGLAASTQLRQYGGPNTLTLGQVLASSPMSGATDETRMPSQQALIDDASGSTMMQPDNNVTPPAFTHQQESAMVGEPRLSLWGYFVKCMKNYANFKGRARRREYWGFFLFLCLIMIVSSLLFGMIIGILQLDESAGDTIIDVYIWVVYLIFLLPLWAVACRRFHDLDRSTKNFALLYALPSGFYLFFSEIQNTFFMALKVVCGILALVCLILFCTDGVDGENEYGPDPKAAERE